MNRVLPGFFLLILLLPLFIRAQISGIVNDYSEVLTIDYVNHSVEVADPAKFALNDRVMLIQMKGVVMNETDSPSFGNPSPVNNAGIYEMATVCDVIASDVFFQYQIENLNNYNPGAVSSPRIQLVKVPQYIDVTVTGTLTAQDWNGTTGGVLAIEVSGTLTLNADIDVSGQGFRGGIHHIANGCGCIMNPTNYYFPNLGTGGNTPDGGHKGEGIADYISNKEYGKGPQVTGGGGGNNHNTGGAGGGNYGMGGNGGYRTGVCCSNFQQGLGGKSMGFLGYSISVYPQIYMGGGGGVGHDNNGDGVGGGDGGGIIMITANSIEGNGNAILADGDSPTAVFGDGGSGGGAGGAILISANNYGVTNLTIEANGGNGGSTGQGPNCPGAGGGGGGGAVWVASVPGGNVTVNYNGGLAGTATGCGSNNGAADGAAGGYMSGLTIPEEIVNLSSCVLAPDVFLSAHWSSRQQVDLAWTREGLEDHSTIEIERSSGLDEPFHTEDVIAFNFQEAQDTWTDFFPVGQRIRYRLKITDPAGAVWYTNQAEIAVPDVNQAFFKVFPNPVQMNKRSMIQVQSPGNQEIGISLIDHTGRLVKQYSEPVSPGNNLLKLHANQLSSGVYVLKITHAGGQFVQTFLVVSH